jgi:hypothetical protein
MKLLRALFSTCALLSVAAAAQSRAGELVASSSMTKEIATKTEGKTETQTESRRLEDEPWDIGTKVYNQFPNEGWWSGTITSFNPATGVYTVTWEDNSTDYYDDDDKIDQMVAYAQNDPQNNSDGAGYSEQTYPSGTAVAVYEDGEWYDGEVSQYGSDIYTIRWDEDGEIEQIPAGPLMDQMVQDAFGDDDAPPSGYNGGPSTSSGAISVGTAVSYYDDEDWIDGQITSYSNGVYTVAWDDGSNDVYDSGDDLAELQQAVADAIGDDDAPPGPISSKSLSGPKFPNGTPVSDWEDGEWVDGEVINFQDGNYMVQWEDETEIEYYDSHNAEDMQELGNMAKDALGDDDAPPDSENEELWEIGTPVSITEDGIEYFGKIEGFRLGEYTIVWDDGEKEYEDDLQLVNQMVSNAAISPKPKSGTSSFGKFLLSLCIISICVVGGVFGFKFLQKRQAEEKRDKDLVVEDADPSYRDQTDRLPKII